MTQPAPQPVALATPAFRIVVLDLTTAATPAALKPGPDLIEAWMEQIEGPFRAAYGDCGGVVMRMGAAPDDRVDGEIACNARDAIPEAQGALAYHQVTNGVEDIELGCSLFTSRGDDTEGLACGGSHELLEMLRDEGANDWRDLDDGSNKTRAGELCDRVQNTGYPACNGLVVSNFLLRSFFIPGAPGPYDYLGVLTSQALPPPGDTIGYEIAGDAPGNLQQYSGKTRALGLGISRGRLVYVHGTLTDAQRRRKAHPYSRTYRRGIRL